VMRKISGHVEPADVLQARTGDTETASRARAQRPLGIRRSRSL
jgi:hypothetical protein